MPGFAAQHLASVAAPAVGTLSTPQLPATTGGSSASTSAGLVPASTTSLPAPSYPSQPATAGSPNVVPPSNFLLPSNDTLVHTSSPEIRWGGNNCMLVWNRNHDLQDECNNPGLGKTPPNKVLCYTEKTVEDPKNQVLKTTAKLGICTKSSHLYNCDVDSPWQMVGKIDTNPGTKIFDDLQLKEFENDPDPEIPLINQKYHETAEKLLAKHNRIAVSVEKAFGGEKFFAAPVAAIDNFLDLPGNKQGVQSQSLS
ncbi:unnamed protein product [Amoebophrya sp. A120]|nr:unnamed protein product [Amoebophrya sp. A120]|eukprot:GSA120T00023099001.1